MSGEQKHCFTHDDTVVSVAFSADGRWLASGDKAKKLIVRDATSGEQKHCFTHGGEVMSVAFSADGRWLASSDSAKKLIVRDATSLSLIHI